MGSCYCPWSPWHRGWLDRKVGGRQGAIVTSLLGSGDRWEELHTLASEPREQHVLMAEQVDDATNGLLSTLSKSAVCTAASPGKPSRLGRSGLAHVKVGLGRFPRARGQEAPQEGGRQEEWGLAALALGCSALSTSRCQALWTLSAGNPEFVSMG